MSERSGGVIALLRRLSGAAFSGGLVMALIGAYYAVVRAGIPYQDPTVEMQISYAIDMGVGSTLLKLGAVLTAVGAALKLLLRSKR